MGSEITQEQLREMGQQILRHYWSDRYEYHGGYESDVFRETRRENRRALKTQQQ